MNNKRGGVGAKIILVLILMIASAIGGAYGYSILDGKLAVKDARKDVEAVRVSDYDSPESTEIQGYIDQVNKDLETAKSRKEVYEIMEDFNSDVAKVKTKTQKELEEAKRAAEEARNNNNNNSNNNNGSNNSYNDNDYNNYDGYNSNNNDYNSNNNNNGSNNSGSNSSNSNSNGNAITNDDGTANKPSAGGLLNSLLGGDDN